MQAAGFFCQQATDNDLSDSNSSQSTNDECSIRALVQTGILSCVTALLINIIGYFQ
jgi:hypothetical protein